MSSPWTLPSLPAGSPVSSALLGPPPPPSVSLPLAENPIAVSPRNASVQNPTTPATVTGDSTMLEASSTVNLLDPTSFPALSSHVNQSPSLPPLNPIPPPSQPSPPAPQPPVSSASPAANWAQNFKKSIDRSLKKVSNPSFSAEGIPRIKIPDSVFQKGAALHQDFVMGVFLGKTPSFSQIQSVLSHIWGKGMKLETHLRPESRSMLVRIPNSELRKKIVEQEFWHVGSVLFYVVQWSDSVAVTPPVFTSMPLWAHFKGIPFDLYTQEGLGRVGDLLGHPLEVDEFTRKMTNINVAHIKCRVDVTKPLPKFGELERENGDVVTVSIEYPWVPPICTCCGDLGHLQTHCPSGVWRRKQTTDSTKNAAPSSSAPAMETPIPPIIPVSQSPSDSSTLTQATVVVPTESIDPMASTSLCLDPDGSIISPPSSPRPHLPEPSLPSSPPSPSLSVSFNHDPLLLQPKQISHLVALPAIHHPKPIKPIPSRKTPPPLPFPESRFLLSANPFAPLDLDPPPSPSLNPPLAPNTLPTEGSLLPVGVKPTH